jgi:uncharacterized membrane protein
MPTLPKDLAELTAAGVIDDATAQRIHAYRTAQAADQPSRLPFIFSILGALLVGLGIVLIVAHNWDDLPRIAKVAAAYIPVLAGLGLCLRALLLPEDSHTAREVGAVILIFAVGACLAMVSQTYHIDGSLSEFLFTWWWLVLPVVYIMRSSAGSLLLWMGAATYGFQVSSAPDDYWIWLFAALLLPYYWWLRQQQQGTLQLLFHDWIMPVAGIAAFMCLPEYGGRLYNGVLYIGFFSLFFLVGNVYFDHKRTGWHLIGWVALVGLLVINSFRRFWTQNNGFWTDWGDFPSALALSLPGAMWLLCVASLVWLWRQGHPLRLHPILYLAALSPGYLLLGQMNDIAGIVMANMLLLGLSLYYIWQGNKQLHLGLLNTGLLIISVQIIARFFDTDMSFTVRGMLFLLLGLCFFAGNRYLIRRQKEVAQNTLHHD